MSEKVSLHRSMIVLLLVGACALSACASTTGCDLTQQAIKDLTYAYNTFEASPAYVRLNGRPVVMFFNPVAQQLRKPCERHSQRGCTSMGFNRCGVQEFVYALG